MSSKVTCTRIVCEQEPDWGSDGQWSGRGVWPAMWVGHPTVADSDVAVIAYRNRLHLDQPLATRLHLTADERYELFINGIRIGRGSEAGSPAKWFYETYELYLPRGEHTLVALTWHQGHAGPSPCARMSLRPGFLCAAEQPEAHTLISTGAGRWEARIVDGYEFSWPYKTELPFTGARVTIHGKDLPEGICRGEGSHWTPARPLCNGVSASMAEEQPDNVWLLAPALLPQLHAAVIPAGVCSHIEPVDSEETESIPVLGSRHIGAEADAWNDMIGSRKPITIPPDTRRRLILDLQNYYCGWVEVSLNGGDDSHIRIGWGEALYEEVLAQAGGYTVPRKGNRDEIEGKYFRGFADVFEPDGKRRAYRPLWWSAGRYLEVYVRTGKAPLTIESIHIEETHYPYEWKDSSDFSDPRFRTLVPILKRTLQMCSHEIYMDCPHYEQLMYIADTRLEVLQTYVTTTDDRLPRKALEMFDLSRRGSGFTQSRYPTRVFQLIPTFSLWWVGMIFDYLMWRDDKAFVKDRMVGVRSVLEAFRRHINADGLIEAPVGWNFIDWVPGWNRGVPQDGEKGVCGPVNFQASWIYRCAARIEEELGEPLLAERNRATADAINAAALSTFWSDKRGLVADDRGHTHFSEHAQCLALLGGALDEERSRRAADGLLTAPDLFRSTIYFSHYLLETYRILGRSDALFRRLEFWFDLVALGMKTTIETPEPSRSDCHGWGAHPLYHLYATILGVRPSQPGFKVVRVQPCLGPLQWAKGSVPHPGGAVSVDVTVEKGALAATVVLPEGVTGELVLENRTVELHGGSNRIAT